MAGQMREMRNVEVGGVGLERGENKGAGRGGVKEKGKEERRGSGGGGGNEKNGERGGG